MNTTRNRVAWRLANFALRHIASADYRNSVERVVLRGLRARMDDVVTFATRQQRSTKLNAADEAARLAARHKARRKQPPNALPAQRHWLVTPRDGAEWITRDAARAEELRTNPNCEVLGPFDLEAAEAKVEAAVLGYVEDAVLVALARLAIPDIDGAVAALVRALGKLRETKGAPQ